MSKETPRHLNTQTLIGFTDKRGHAWHYRAEEQGDESNHYPGAVPVDDVRRRLFHWKAIDLPIFVPVPDQTVDASHTIDGVDVTMTEVLDRKAIARDDTYAILGIHSDGFQSHQFDDVLLSNLATLLDQADGELGIGSAGLLRGGALAWVQVEVPENVSTPEGFTYRPNLTASSALDGSLSTTYKRMLQAVVCDNTLEIGLAEKGTQVKVRHSRYSQLKLDDAREALQIIHQSISQIDAEIARLAKWRVTTKAFNLFLDAIIPTDESSSARTLTIAENKRAELVKLYTEDERCAPWTGSALGVLQATNTYSHHVGSHRGNRAERNQLRAILGQTGTADITTLQTLAKFTNAPALVTN